MKSSTRLILSVLVVVLLTGGLIGYYEITGETNKTSSVTVGQSSTTNPTLVTGTSVATASDTLFTVSCSITGIGGFGLLVVADSTGAPVGGETVNAVDYLGCGSMPQVVYLNNFTVGQDGWLTPVFPAQATPGGVLNFTVVYQGHAYDFRTSIAFVGSNCVTLQVPSGTVTTKNVMNGYGSACYQG
jgi:hypothetical protein